MCWFKKKEKIKKEKVKEKEESIFDKDMFSITFCINSNSFHKYYHQKYFKKSDIVWTNNKDKFTVIEVHYSESCSPLYAIEEKVNCDVFKITDEILYYKFEAIDEWRRSEHKNISKELISTKTPLENFKEMETYKLIETEEEFKEYLESKLNADDWCRKKLVTKMKELQLGSGFINAFADLIGNHLEKYHQMIDLASEVGDKDVLMYLYTYKFGEKE